MQFSERSLNRFVNNSLQGGALMEALTMAGLEVEASTALGNAFTGVVVAKILSLHKHPHADRLNICHVTIGDEILQIVCGANNARVGLLVACARIGAVLPNNLLIRKTKVRDIESAGMLCSAAELGLKTESEGLLELSSDAPIGADLDKFLPVDDHIIHLKLTPNRSDCLNLLGIAREVVALGTGHLVPPTITPAPVVEQVAQKSLHITPSHICPRYCGRVIRGVKANAQTPQWMTDALIHAGFRLHNAVVNISNYVLLALGQPMHTFDAHQLHGDITVRFARNDETLLLLNEQEVRLNNNDVVIADEKQPLALAGIMGGLTSAVTETSTDIFLESAFFPPTLMQGRARRLGLNTDAAYRYERGVDFAITRDALEYATALIQGICGGEAGAISEVQSELPSRKAVLLRLSRVNAVLGLNLDLDTVKSVFERLNFHYMLSDQDESLMVTPPSYRFDLKIEEDFIEEVARIYGYAHIPALLPHNTSNMLTVPEHQHPPVNKMRDTLIAQGYQEIISLSFGTDETEKMLFDNLNPVRLKNPIVNNYNVMRSSLWQSLLEALMYNVHRHQQQVMLFEIGNCYTWTETQKIVEELHIAGIAYGTAVPKQWLCAEREFDFFDLKADIESLFGETLNYKKPENDHLALHPGQTAQVLQNNQPIGWLGQLHPRWQQFYALPKPAYLFDINLSRLHKLPMMSFRDTSKGWPVRRDLAVVVDINLPVQELLIAISNANLTQVSNLFVFDVYSGHPMPVNQKSVALSMLISDNDGALTNEDADAIAMQVLKILKENCSAALRN